MKEPTPTGEPPAVTVVEITDPTAASAGIELLDLDAVQLQSMPLRVRRVIVRLGSAAVVFHATNARVRTRTSVRQGLLAYTVFGPQASGTANGLPVRPGLMLAVEPETKVAFVADGGWESIGFLLPPEDIREHLVARRREDEFRLPRGAEPLQVDAGRVRGLFEWGKLLVDTASQQPDLFDGEPRKRAFARDELLETLLATLRIAGDFESTRSDRTRQAQSAIVKRAEDYALAQTGDRLYVTDLCKVAAVSERTLEYAFKEIMGLAPVTYLARLRLHRVREALLAAAPGSAAVSTEALKWGFWHLGEFSRAYKACFGELPSETLRRVP
ncbi:MAG: helix-turn-helix domain-containing protein [Steroidobacteraceae bacterium]|jgi:AraC-like DNA-binding protein|nr:helix-turn-helix domain-containing protein [Steroidobacteraceae bacterium]